MAGTRTLGDVKERNMTFPRRRVDTGSGLSVLTCDVYLTGPRVGMRVGIARRLAAQVLEGVAVWVTFLIVELLSAGAAAARR
jgi:small-conductance mechanosensitive channel